MKSQAVGKIVREATPNEAFKPKTIIVQQAEPFGQPLNEAFAWNVETVQDYLRSVIELPQYEKEFLRCEINGRNFICLDGSKVKALGIQHKMHSAKILAHANKLMEIVCQHLASELPSDFLTWKDVHVAAWLRTIVKCPSSSTNGLLRRIDGLKVKKMTEDDLSRIFTGSTVDETKTAVKSLLQRCSESLSSDKVIPVSNKKKTKHKTRMGDRKGRKFIANNRFDSDDVRLQEQTMGDMSAPPEQDDDERSVEDQSTILEEGTTSHRSSTNSLEKSVRFELDSLRDEGSEEEHHVQAPVLVQTPQKSKGMVAVRAAVRLAGRTGKSPTPSEQSTTNAKTVDDHPSSDSDLDMKEPLAPTSAESRHSSEHIVQNITDGNGRHGGITALRKAVRSGTWRNTMHHEDEDHLHTPHGGDMNVPKSMGSVGGGGSEGIMIRQQTQAGDRTLFNSKRSDQMEEEEDDDDGNPQHPDNENEDEVEAELISNGAAKENVQSRSYGNKHSSVDISPQEIKTAKKPNNETVKESIPSSQAEKISLADKSKYKKAKSLSALNVESTPEVAIQQSKLVSSSSSQTNDLEVEKASSPQDSQKSTRRRNESISHSSGDAKEGTQPVTGTSASSLKSTPSIPKQSARTNRDVATMTEGLNVPETSSVAKAAKADRVGQAVISSNQWERTQRVVNSVIPSGSLIASGLSMNASHANTVLRNGLQQVEAAAVTVANQIGSTIGSGTRDVMPSIVTGTSRLRSTVASARQVGPVISGAVSTANTVVSELAQQAGNNVVSTANKIGPSIAVGVSNLGPAALSAARQLGKTAKLTASQIGSTNLGAFKADNIMEELLHFGQNFSVPNEDVTDEENGLEGINPQRHRRKANVCNSSVYVLLHHDVFQHSC